MDISATLNEIKTLNIEDRIFIVQAIWDSIAAEQVYPDLSEKQKKELDTRINDSESNPENVLTWEEIKTSIKRKYQNRNLILPLFDFQNQPTKIAILVLKIFSGL